MSNRNVTIYTEAFNFSNFEMDIFETKYNNILITDEYKDFVAGRLDEATITKLARSLLETRFYY